jgi:hypothetical protein
MVSDTISTPFLTDTLLTYGMMRSRTSPYIIV